MITAMFILALIVLILGALFASFSDDFSEDAGNVLAGTLVIVSLVLAVLTVIKYGIEMAG